MGEPQKVVVRLEGAFDSYPQNLPVLANAIRFFGRMLIPAALILAVGMIAAAAIIASGVS